MSELTEPYLKIACFCKQLIFSMGRYQGAIAGASLGGREEQGDSVSQQRGEQTLHRVSPALSGKHGTAFYV